MFKHFYIAKNTTRYCTNKITNAVQSTKKNKDKIPAFPPPPTAYLKMMSAVL
jgi:hypothetical protein